MDQQPVSKEKVYHLIADELVPVFADEESVKKSLRLIFRVFKENPGCRKDVEEAREKFSVPRGGFKNESQIFIWEKQGNATNSRVLWGHIDRLILEFYKNIPPRLASDFRFFFYRYILFPGSIDTREASGKVSKKNYAWKFTNRKILLGLVYKSKKTKRAYIEITSDTTLNDILEMQKYLEIAPSVRGTYKFSKIQEIAHRAWVLRQEGLETDEIARMLNKEFGKNFGYNNINTYIGRYEKVLKNFRNF